MDGSVVTCKHGLTPMVCIECREDEIDRLKAEIERLRGKLNRIRDLVNLSPNRCGWLEGEIADALKEADDVME